MNKRRRWGRKKIVIGVMVSLSVGILGLGLGLRSQMQQHREFLDTELVVAVHELNQLQREVLRLRQQVTLLPAVPLETVQVHTDLTQSRMVIVQKRIQSRRDRQRLHPEQANPELMSPEQDQAVDQVIAHWMQIKQPIELLLRPASRPRSIGPLNATISQQLEALELEINQAILRNRELQWQQYQLLLSRQVRSLNYVTLLLICFFMFAALFGWYAVKFIETRQRLLEKMKQMSTTDELTQIANRRCFNQIFEREWNRMRRDSQSIAVILSDIDFFKQYNDYYGHQAGDRCLQQVAQVLADGVRRSGEFVARYGGEEFVLVMANTTPEQVKSLTDRLQAQLHQCALIHDRSAVSPYVTMSIGIAIGIPTRDFSPEQALASADAALYQAKSQGRNQSCVHIFG